MRRIILLLSALAFILQAVCPQVFQLPNPGFEIWDGSGNDDEPTFWNGFPSAECNLLVGCGAATETRHAKSTDTRPGSAGMYSLKLFATEVNILGNTIVANGTISTGQIRIGSTTATNSQNYNITRTNNSDFRQALNAKPDSISFWAKFVCPSSVQQARISAIIHANYPYRDPEFSDPQSANYVVAKAVHNFVRGNQGWRKITVPFDYDFPASTPEYILITFTTNKNAGVGSASDVLYIDDIELIYNPRLSDIKLNGISLPDFHPEITEYQIEVDCYTPVILTATSESQHASMYFIQPTFNQPNASIQVVAGNISKTYSINISYQNTKEVHAEICSGESFSGWGFNIPVNSTAGVYSYKQTVYQSPGCDSILQLILTVNPSYYPDTVYATICENGFYDFFGQHISEAGIYDTLIFTAKGCDSLVVLNLSVGEYYQTNINASICEGSIYADNGFNRTEAGTDTLFLKASDGCDSLVVLNLSLNPVFNIFLYDTLTAGKPYNSNGFSIPDIEQPGNYSYTNTFKSIYGCDSIVNLKLKVVLPPEEEVENYPEFALSVYPNPVFDFFKIEILTTSTALFNYELFDLFGKMIKQDNIFDAAAKVDVSELLPGVYILRVSSSLGISEKAKIIRCF